MTLPRCDPALSGPRFPGDGGSYPSQYLNILLVHCAYSRSCARYVLFLFLDLVPCPPPVSFVHGFALAERTVQANHFAAGWILFSRLPVRHVLSGNRVRTDVLASDAPGQEPCCGPNWLGGSTRPLDLCCGRRDSSTSTIPAAPCRAKSRTWATGDNRHRGGANSAGSGGRRTQPSVTLAGPWRHTATGAIGRRSLHGARISGRQAEDAADSDSSRQGGHPLGAGTEIAARPGRARRASRVPPIRRESEHSPCQLLPRQLPVPR